MILNIVNTQAELDAFPVTQELVLKSDLKPEDAFLKKCIVLYRDNKEFGLFNLGTKYNNSIGYIKENFSTVDLNFNLTQELDGSWTIHCKPSEPLHPSSYYTLYISKNLSTEFIVLEKTVSKGPSKLDLTLNKYSNTYDTTYTVKVLTTPLIKDGKAIVKFGLYDVDLNLIKTFIIDTKSSINTFEYDGLTFETSEIPYAKDEEFTLVTETQNRLADNLKVSIRTNLYDTITTTESSNPSTKITNQDILDYYSSVQNVPNTVSSVEPFSYTLQYVDFDKFVVTFNNLDVSTLDLSDITFTVGPAFNNYLLKTYDLYDDTLNYNIIAEVVDDDKLLITVTL
jgi:hypothetical protein